MSKRTVHADLLDQLNRKVSILGAVIEGACTEVTNNRLLDGLHFCYEDLTDTINEVNRMDSP